jgi:hypothetical protein
MIHIIEEGTKQKIQCSECGCIFSFEKDDIEIISNYNPYQDYNPIRKTIKCPQCSNIIVLEAIK